MNVKNMIGKAPGATAPKFFSFIILFILTASLFNINAQDVIEKWVTIFGSNQSDYAADITANDSGI